MKFTPLNVKLKSEQHHWWPIAVSGFWADDDGMVSRITWGSNTIRQDPAKFGSIGNAHHVDLKGPWTHTFEPLFNDADSYFPHLLKELLQLNSFHNVDHRKLLSRLSDPLEISATSERLISECLASLVVRSPRFRDIVMRSVNAFGAYQDGISDRHLIVASNIGRCFEPISISRCALTYVLYSDNSEFTFGDGFFNVFNSVADPIRYVRLMIPLLPQMAVACIYSSNLPRQIRTIRLTDSEVRDLNHSTQIYSSKYLFYRSLKPHIDDRYFNGKFMQIRDHRLPFLENLKAACS